MSGAHRTTVLLVVASVVLAPPSRADEGDLLQSWDFRASKFALHPTEPVLYATLPDLNSVAVINTQTLSLVDTVFIGSNPHGLAVSPDGARLFVANSGSTFLGVMDTNTLETLPSLLLPERPADVEIGLEGRAYISPAATGGIMQLDTNTGEFLGDFSHGVSIYHFGMLEISPGRTSLYFANRGLSPGTLAEYGVSTSEPTLEYQNPHGSLGSNGQDLALSHNGEFISYACGSGNGSGYTIFKLRTTDYAVLGEFECGPYPREITFGADDMIAYTVHTSGLIDRFDTETFLPLEPFNTSGEAEELIVDSSGRHLFAAFDGQLRVYDTGVPEPASLSLLAFGGLLVIRRRQ
jgi:YVTN family beta-propeller protein